MGWLRGRWESGSAINLGPPDTDPFSHYPFKGRVEFLRAAHELLNLHLGKSWADFVCALRCLRMVGAGYDDVWKP